MGARRFWRHVASILGPGTTTLLAKALPRRARGWRILPVVGRRDRPAQVIGEAIKAAGLCDRQGAKESGRRNASSTRLKRLRLAILGLAAA